ncbi:MAG: hypothetical protein IKO01_09100 [Kiritimatiellae bacterium]|nr:hypothetical protein [Kiritimatiellia bacterium]
MLDHAQEIYETPYGRETDGAGNLKITGPFSKALEVHNGFWDNDTKAAELRETLGEDDRARLEQEYTNWGFALQSDSAKKQSELNQQYMLKNWKDRGNTLKGEISNSLERGDVDAWKRSMMEYVEFAGEGAKIELGIRDLGGGLKRQPTEQEAATISDVKRATAETLAMERIEFLHRAYIMDGDADTLAEIQAWGAEQALSDAGRLHARELAADAETKRKQVVANQMAEADNTAWNAANQRLEEVMGLDNPMEQREAFWELRETRFHDPQKKRELNEKIDVRLDAVNTEEAYGALALIAKDAGNPNIIHMADKCRRKVENIADPKKREAALTLLDGLVGDAEFVSWREKYDKAIGEIEQMDFDPEALDEVHGRVRQLIGEIAGFRSARGKQLAAEHTVAVRNEIQAQYTQKTVDVLKHRWYRDPATGRLVNQDKLDALDTFDKWIPFMDRKQLDEVAEAFSKMPVPLQEEDFAGLGGLAWRQRRG